MSEQVQSQYDVIIVGGGLVGASLACALGQTGLRIAVIEAAPFTSKQQPSFDARTVALAYVSRQIFAAMGLWSRIEELGVAAIEHIHVSDRGHAGVTRMHSADVGVEAMGYVVDTRVLGQAMHERLAELSSVKLYCPAELQAFHVEADAAHVSFVSNGQSQTIQARLLIAADGGNSLVRRLSGMDIFKVDYGQSAIIANVETDTPHAGRAFERFTDTGPMAILPMPVIDGVDSRYAMVWTVPNKDRDEVLALDDETFLQRLQLRFRDRAGQFVRVSQRFSYPLTLMQTREHVRPRLAVIGNAAHVIHPAAGQGFNLGLRDVAAISQVVVDAMRSGRDIGDAKVLQAYAEWRRRDQLQTSLATDGLVRIFSSHFLPIAAARNFGLIALDLLPPLKRFFARQAMGYVGKLPRLARGLPL